MSQRSRIHGSKNLPAKVLPELGIEPMSPASPALAGHFTPEPLGKLPLCPTNMLLNCPPRNRGPSQSWRTPSLDKGMDLKMQDVNRGRCSRATHSHPLSKTKGLFSSCSDCQKESLSGQLSRASSACSDNNCPAKIPFSLCSPSPNDLTVQKQKGSVLTAPAPQNLEVSTPWNGLS